MSSPARAAAANMPVTRSAARARARTAGQSRTHVLAGDVHRGPGGFNWAKLDLGSGRGPGLDNVPRPGVCVLTSCMSARATSAQINRIGDRRAGHGSSQPPVQRQIRSIRAVRALCIALAFLAAFRPRPQVGNSG